MKHICLCLDGKSRVVGTTARRDRRSIRPFGCTISGNSQRGRWFLVRNEFELGHEQGF